MTLLLSVYVARCPGCKGEIRRPMTAPPRAGYNDDLCPSCGHCVTLRGSQYKLVSERKTTPSESVSD
jgi:rRNA maturation endonuclease Nob1